MKQSLNKAMKPEEIGFQINYSRSILKGIIKQYPMKDVRKSIEHFIAKVRVRPISYETCFTLIQRPEITAYRTISNLYVDCLNSIICASITERFRI